jgi:hypothetical protein
MLIPEHQPLDAHPRLRSLERSAGMWDGSRVALAVIVVFYFWFLAAKSGGSIFEPALFGFVFNNMALNLLQGRFDIDPGIIGVEAFVRDGRSYAYFGVFPALLRLPLVPILDLDSVSLARLYIFLALSVGALAQAASVSVAVSASPMAPARDAISTRLLLATLLSGPPIMLALSGTVYDESLAWAWALSNIFVGLTLREATRTSGFGTTALATMAAVAGLCLLTRPTTALGLHVSLALIMSWLLLTRNRERPDLTRPAWHRLLQRRFAIPTAIVLGFASLAALVNFARWGNPLVVADMHAQVHLLALFPDRLGRLDEYGLFNPIRIGYGMLYYFLPVWAIPVGGTYPLQNEIREMFDAFELPPSSFILSDPLTLLLATVGVVSLTRRCTVGLPRAPVLCLLSGLIVAPVMMLMAWYMAFRYRLEFSPLFLTLACQGAVTWIDASTRWSRKKLRHVTAILGSLLIAQIASAHLHALLYVASRIEMPESILVDGPVSFYKAALLKLMWGI